MRQKIYKILNHVYGVLMTVSFFAGILPLIPFIIAIIIGGETGEAISVFLYKQFYPWVILLASVAIVIGLIAMYVSKSEGLSLKSISEKKTDEENTENAESENTKAREENGETADSEIKEEAED